MVDLFYDSMRSPIGLLGHFSYMLLIVSMMMRRMLSLRLIAVLSGLFSFAFDLWILNPVGAFWDLSLVLVNVAQLVRMGMEMRNAVFSPEEEDFLRATMPALDRTLARRLLNHGIWIDGESGTQLTSEGEPVLNLIYLVNGQARVSHDNHDIAICTPGSFVGEMTVMTGQPATGTVTLSRPSRYLALHGEAIRSLAFSFPDIKQALDAAFSSNMREKLVASNRSLKEKRTGN